MNGKTALYLSVAALGIFVAAMLAVQPYSADWPGGLYVSPARRYIAAALNQDTLALRHLSLSGNAVAWALEAGRSHRLDPWRDRLEVWTGERRGDTAEVFVYPSDAPREMSPIVFRFVGAGSDAKVLEAGSR